MQNYKVFTNNKFKTISKNDWDDFVSNYLLIEAAGGLVYNQHNQLLMIFRNTRWDLPKGKIKKNERPEKAALREIEEECGVRDLIIKNKLIDTYHTYILHEKHILKKTYWYKINTNYNSNLIPQLNEGITKVCWVNPNEIKDKLRNSFGTIIQLLS